jgi:periplasmic protein TonB
MDLVSLNASHPDDRHMSLWKMASIGLHVLVFVALTYHFRGLLKPHPHKKLNARKLVAYAPGHTAPTPPVKPKIRPPVDKPKLVTKEPPPPPPASGGDPLGESDVTVALADFYPTPKPDLTQLPHGTKGDVVIDITIDEDGKVVDEKIDQSLNQGVDEAVLSMVQTWTFTPATKAGKPVASQQQLLFHYERA